jgi:hypothetical protein
MAFVSAGVTAAAFFHIVETTANGAIDLDPPDFTDFWASLVSPVLRMVSTLLPLFIAWALSDVSMVEALASTPRAWLGEMGPALVVVALWFFLWPLLILVAAISRSVVTTFDPRAWMHLLRELRGDYLLGAALFYAILLVEIFVLVPVVWRVAALVPIPVVTSIAAHFVLLLPFAARARILGETARPCVEGV